MKSCFLHIIPLLLLCFGTSAQIEKVFIETYYISDNFDSTDIDGGKLEAGSVTYRIFVDLQAGNKLLGIYGDKNHALKFSSTRPFFNNIDGETYGNDLKKGVYNYNTVALDTWLTLGQTTKPVSGKANFGIRKSQDTNGSFIGGANNDGGSAAIAGGLLVNSESALGIPLTTSDGMDTMTAIPASWSSYGIKDFLSGIDSSMFGSVIQRSSFESHNMFLRNSGVTGVLPDSNQILIAQLTTKGELSFELNLEVEQLVDGVIDTVRYVANADTLVLSKNEKKSSYLKYPFPPAMCGCKDPAFLEYDPTLECSNTDSCFTLIKIGCTDKMACNFDPEANLSVPTLCCYPGSCGGRDISNVCPDVRGNSFEIEIYPNPTSGNIFLNLTAGEPRKISFLVFDCFGTIVINKELGLTERIYNEEINLSELSSGIYFIRTIFGTDFVTKQIFKVNN